MLKKIFYFYINSSIHLSLEVVCLTLITFHNLDIPLNENFLIFVFFGTITGYNFVKYAGIAKLHHRSLAKNLQVIQIFSLVCFLAFIYFSLIQPVAVIIFGGIMGVFILLYAIPVFSENRNLRGLNGVKVYVIAFVVAGVTVIMPAIYSWKVFQWDHFLEFFQRFSFVIVVMLPFEIRDLKYDMVQLGTIPQRLGVKGSKILGTVLLGFFILTEFLKQETSLPEVLSVLIIGIIAFIFLKRSRINQGEFYSSFWVEAIPIFWWLILTVLTYYFSG
jgi:hypothetical protein